MKLPENLEAAFSEQITMEFEASLVYRQLGIEMDVRDLPGMASWFRLQADEEIAHGHRFIDHLTDRDNHPRIGAIPGRGASASPASSSPSTVRARPWRPAWPT